MNASVEWLVAWRYLRDRDRPTYIALGIGLALLVLSGVLWAVAEFVPRESSATLWGMPVHGLALAGRQALGLAGLLTTLFGASLVFFNLFTTISIFGVFLGVTALIVVLSVMSGFEEDLERKILGNNAHILVKGQEIRNEATILADLGVKQAQDAHQKKTDDDHNGTGDQKKKTNSHKAASNHNGIHARKGPANRRATAGSRPNSIRRMDGRIPGANHAQARKNSRHEAVQGETHWDESVRAVVPNVVAVSPYLQSEVILTGPKTHTGVYLKGIIPSEANHVYDLGKNIVEGVLSNLSHPERLRYLYFPPDEYEMVPDQAPPESATPLSGAKVRNRGATKPGGMDRRSGSQIDSDQPPKNLVVHHAARDIVGAQPTANATRLPISAPKGINPLQPRPGTGGHQPGGLLAVMDQAARQPARPNAQPSAAPKAPDMKNLEALMGPLTLPRQDTGAATDFGSQPMPPGFLAADQQVYPGMILGRELAKSLGLTLGQTVDAISTANGAMGPMGPVPTVKTFRVAGIFYSGHYEFDSKYAYVLLSEAQNFLGKKGKITGVEIRVSKTNLVDKVAEALRSHLPQKSHLSVLTWRQVHRSLFSALKLEKLAMFLVLAIIVCVASFSIGANLIMIVRKKRQEIAIIKAMGADDSQVYRIFVIKGLYIGIIGLLLGLGVGLSACAYLAWFGMPLDPDVYYISRLPVHVDWRDVLSIASASLAISFVATVYPAWQAAQLHPVEAFRDE